MREVIYGAGQKRSEPIKDGSYVMKELADLLRMRNIIMRNSYGTDIQILHILWW
jgi:hypothetical protein